MIIYEKIKYCFFKPLKLLLLVAFCLSVDEVMAQVVLSGKVTNADDGKPIEFANVGIVGLSKGTTTNARGVFEIKLPLADSVTLRFSFTGFESRNVVVFPRLMAKDPGSAHLDVELHASATLLKEVAISDDGSRSTGFTHIDVARIDASVAPNNGVESILKTLPDVSSNNEMSSQYSVRGGSFDENLVYINGVEVFRPMLIRSGQQEGLSIINPDMVDHLYFSPGGFDVTYGDKISSALDISYSRPTEFKNKVSASFLGATASSQGAFGEKWAYSAGLRYHSNRYLFSSLDTKGAYHTAYFDFQGVLWYKASDVLDLSLLLVSTQNRYGLVPESQTTTFGSFMQSLELDVFFDGQEEDRYRTNLAALTLTFAPSQSAQLKWTTSFQSNVETENYDIQSQYWLYELGMGSDASVNKFDRGVGTFLEHARNSLSTTIFNSQLRGFFLRPNGNLRVGIDVQYESVYDRLKEWKWVDSAGFAMPTSHLIPAVEDTLPLNPLLQRFANADNHVSNLRGLAFVQRELNFTTAHSHQLSLVAGLRVQCYSSSFESQNLRESASELDSKTNLLASPRLSFNFQPAGRSMWFRLAAGVYQQPPLYRELRFADGALNPHVAPQTSYQTSATFDWDLSLWEKPFRLTTDVYYKYISDLIPYTIDNLRIRYDAQNSAVGYATGVSLRLNGEFVKGLESWASLSVMKTQEDILGDGLGWIDRPTDQRFSFKLFFQDYLPSLPWWRMSLNFSYGTGVPVTFPFQSDRTVTHRLPSYFRVDWGNTLQLSKFERLKHWSLFRFFDDILLSVEVFNLFNYHNVVSYIWVSDYDNIYYPVPNYLTARQLNLKLTLVF